MQPQDQPFEWKQPLCPSCGRPVDDWADACQHCGSAMPQPERATGAEMAHIIYLLTQFPLWQQENILSPANTVALRQRYQTRLHLLHRKLHAPAPPIAPTTQTASVEPSAGPAEVVPPASPPHGTHTASPPPVVETPAFSLLNFCREHALKIVFVLASILTLAALQSMLHWEEFRTYALLLIPLLALGLVPLFHYFGQKARPINPWAAFVYHSVSAVLGGFAILAMNIYWFPGAIPTKTSLLLSGLAVTGLAGWHLTRWREASYLHLFQTGVFPTLYLGLQHLRVGVSSQDYRPTPLLLFGVTYLGYGLLCFLVSRGWGDTTSHTSETAPLTRQQGFLWGHLAVIGAGGMGVLDAAFTEGFHQNLGVLALLMGCCYVGLAQWLRDARQVWAAMGCLLAGIGLLLLDFPFGGEWQPHSIALLALSAFACVMATYNRRLPQGETPNGLADAYRYAAKLGTALASLLLWGYLTEIILTSSWREPISLSLATLIPLWVSGLYYVLFAFWERKPPFLYGTLATGGLGLIASLHWRSAPLGAYPLTLLLYAGLLGLIAIALQRRANIEREWSTPFVLFCHLLAGTNLTWLALAPLAQEVKGWWMWSLLGMGVGVLLYAPVAWYGRSAWATTLTGSLLAYLGALLLWRVLPASPSLFPLLALSLLGMVPLLIATLLYREADHPQDSTPNAQRPTPNALLWALIPYLVGYVLLVTTQAEPLLPLWAGRLAEGLWVLDALLIAGIGFRRAWRERTPILIAVASMTLTALCLHFLARATGWNNDAESLSLPMCGLLMAQVGVAWVGLASLWRRTETGASLAEPLLPLAGGLALLSAVVGLWGVQEPEQGRWTILLLLENALLWFTLWRMQVSAVCIHVGMWNTIAASFLILYDQFGFEPGMHDLYLLPVGLYLLACGHLQAREKRHYEANLAWWGGLLLILGPTLLAHWTDARAYHAVLLIGECTLAIGWGIANRIRAYASAGLGFALLYGLSTLIGYLPEVWGTLASLLLGLSLFILGFYALTHREALRRWLTQMEAHWRQWQAWQ